MPRAEPLELIGVLLGEGPYPTLRMADGGESRLDINGRYRHLLGQRVRITGRLCNDKFGSRVTTNEMAGFHGSKRKR